MTAGMLASIMAPNAAVFTRDLDLLSGRGGGNYGCLGGCASHFVGAAVAGSDRNLEGPPGLPGWGIGGPPSGAVLVVGLDATPTALGATPAPTATAVGGVATVYASGAVQHPGVYTLPPTARVAELLQLAGGPAPDADLDQVNLALP